MAAVALTLAIAVLALASGVIHLSLGAPIFILNALGYFALVVAYVVAATVSQPLVSRFRWVPRVALLAYAVASIVGWLLLGGFYWLGYVTKAIELTLIVLLIVDIYRVHGGLSELTREAVASVRWAIGAIRSH